MDYEDAKAVFRQFDIDNSGGIDEVELFAALSDFGLSAQDCDDIFYELDTDGNGCVTEDEFCKGWAAAFNMPQERSQAKGEACKDPLFTRKRELIYAMVCGLEGDNDGEVAEEELVAFAQLFDEKVKSFGDLQPELQALNGLTRQEALEPMLLYLPDEKEEHLEWMLEQMQEKGMTVQLLASRHLGTHQNIEDLQRYTLEERRRELIVQIVGSMDGDNNGAITEDEVLRYWRIFFPAPSFDYVDEEVQQIAGKSKDEAIEMFIQLAHERQLSLDDLMQDVDQIRATGLTVPSRKAYCRQIIGAMDGDDDGTITRDEVLRVYQVFEPEVEAFEYVDPALKQAAGQSRDVAIQILYDTVTERALLIEDLEEKLLQLASAGFKIPVEQAVPEAFDSDRVLSAQEIKLLAQKRQMIATIVVSMDGDRDGTITEAEVLRFQQVFDEDVTKFEDVDKELAEAAGKSRREVLKAFMKSAEEKDVDDLACDLAQIKFEGIKIATQEEADAAIADMQTKSGQDPVVMNMITVAKKLELVAEMIAGIRGDAEGNWTQEQIMQCYKVFKPNCSGWQEVEPAVQAVEGKPIAEGVKAFYGVAERMSMESMTALATSANAKQQVDQQLATE